VAPQKKDLADLFFRQQLWVHSNIRGLPCSVSELSQACTKQIKNHFPATWAQIFVELFRLLAIFAPKNIAGLFFLQRALGNSKNTKRKRSYSGCQEISGAIIRKGGVAKKCSAYFPATP
jgi:hypothetical protein